MRVLIMADMEGAAGVDDHRQCRPEYPEFFAVGQEHMAQDVNAATRGLRRAGATEVDVVDGHRAGENLVPERLDPGVKLLGGGAVLFELARTDGWRKYDAFVILAQHAMAGTRDGFISHSNSSYTAMRMNGMDAGELEKNAWFAGFYDIPTILVTGDDATVREAQAILPGIPGVVVKTCRSRTDVTLIPTDIARTQIEGAAEEALRNLSLRRVYKLQGPVEVETIFSGPQYARSAAIMPGTRMVNEVTLAYRGADFVEALRAYYTLVRLGGGASTEWIMGRIRSVPAARKALEEAMHEEREHWVNAPPPFPLIKF